MEGISAYFPRDLREDPDRLAVLYAPFRDKTINPVGYESKLKTWQEAVKSYMRVNKTAIVDYDSLMIAFTTAEDQRPQCLNKVLIESTTTTTTPKTLIPERDYVNCLRVDQRGWIPWAVGVSFDYLVKKPVSATWNWAWSSIVGSASADGGVKGPLISPEMVAELSEKLLRFCNDPGFREKCAKTSGSSVTGMTSLLGVSAMEDAVEYDALRRETTSVVADEKTLSILLTALAGKDKVRLSKVDIGDGEEKTFVFFDGGADIPRSHKALSAAAASSASSTSLSSSLLFSSSTPVKVTDPKRRELTEKDKAVLQLDVTSRKLIKDIETIHVEMERCREEAKRYLAAGMKPLALNCLKRKKRLQSKLEAGERSLENIETMISKLQDVDANKMVYTAYKEAVAALNKSLSETDIDAIEDTMDDMKEAFDRQAEIEEALSGKQLLRDGLEEEDEDELESELKRILKENDDDLDVDSEFILPEVPTDEVEDLFDKLCISPLKDEAEKKTGVVLEPQLAL